MMTLGTSRTGSCLSVCDLNLLDVPVEEVLDQFVSSGGAELWPAVSRALGLASLHLAILVRVMA
jgi:hypothetical protein